MKTVEGGILLTDSKDIYDKVLFLRDHGHKPGDSMFFNEQVAYKYKMSAVQAALGLAQLERIDELVGKKRQIFEWYEENLSGVEGITLNYEAPGTNNTYWMVTAILEARFGIEKLRLIEVMARENIDCRPFFFPLSMIPAYKNHEEAIKAQARNNISYSLSPYAINLPSGMNMSEERIKYVCGALEEVMKNSESEQ